MAFRSIDHYLLGEPVSKAAVVEALLADRSPLPAAAPFYRALEAVGSRVADEAFVALRLVLAGREPTDDAVRRLRAYAGVARLARHGEGAPLSALFTREPAILATLPRPPDADAEAIRRAAEQAYRMELGEADADAAGTTGGPRNVEPS